jgi:hypothetical protein
MARSRITAGDQMASAAISLDQLLMLVGELNDQQGQDTPRDRFRQFLSSSVTAVGTVRDYVQVCLAKKGDQYDRALQDLVNHAGRLMGFDVEFGRYSGVANDIGHDGLWRADDFSVVVEVKTSGAFTIRTATLLGYINSLIDVGRISRADTAMGLYVFGKPDAEISQLEASIIHSGHAQRLRIATADDVLALAELVQRGLLSRDEALALLRPVGVRVGSTVQVLQRIAAGMPSEVDEPLSMGSPEPIPFERTAPRPRKVAEYRPSSSPMYLLTPVAAEDGISAEETIRSLLDHGVYVFGERTTGRKDLKPGDQIAFYESGNGIVACAEVASQATRKTIKFAKHAENYPWAFDVRNVRYFFDEPVIIDAELRAKLERFQGRDPQSAWGWFVQGTRKVSEHDFRILTRQ